MRIKYLIFLFSVIFSCAGAEIVRDGKACADIVVARNADAGTRQAAQVLADWRLRGCTLYVTLEPCPMCAGGIINARIEAVRYGARDEKAGCCASVLNLFEERFNHRPRIYEGPRRAECEAILQDFFENLRGGWTPPGK